MATKLMLLRLPDVNGLGLLNSAFILQYNGLEQVVVDVGDGEAPSKATLRSALQPRPFPG